MTSNQKAVQRLRRELSDRNLVTRLVDFDGDEAVIKVKPRAGWTWTEIFDDPYV